LTGLHYYTKPSEGAKADRKSKTCGEMMNLGPKRSQVMSESYHFQAVSELISIFPDSLEHAAPVVGGAQTALVNTLTDPFAPVPDMDNIFDEKETSSFSIQPRPLQEMMDSVMDFDMLKTTFGMQVLNEPLSAEVSPIITSRVLSAVFVDLEDITPGPLLCMSRPSDAQASKQSDTPSVSEVTTYDAVVGVVNSLARDHFDSSIFDTTQSSAIAPPCKGGFAVIGQNDHAIFPSPLYPQKRDLTDKDNDSTEHPSKKRKTLKHSDSEDSESSSALHDDAAGGRFRVYQAEKWMVKFEELVEYKKTHGHCQVPHSYKQSPTLARWAKRQRYQYKLFDDGKPSTMTEERVVSLEELGFVWDSHSALWEERYMELQQYCLAFGHSNVPSTFPPNPKLAIWVKCQRRQYKLLVAGEASNMTYERIERLNKLNFVWEVRKTGF
jgi:hypothetical protein